ncbi:MAG: HypC/HybG/HupF family hydrogenase formation chaperone [Nitrospirota bacterium]
MCLGIPAKVVRINDQTATVEVSGVMKEIGLHLVDDIVVGDYVIVHAGYAINKINEEEARETLQLLRRLGDEVYR